MVKYLFSKENSRVRFPLPAPKVMTNVEKISKGWSYFYSAFLTVLLFSVFYLINIFLELIVGTPLMVLLYLDLIGFYLLLGLAFFSFLKEDKAAHFSKLGLMLTGTLFGIITYIILIWALFLVVGFS